MITTPETLMKPQTYRYLILAFSILFAAMILGSRASDASTFLLLTAWYVPFALLQPGAAQAEWRCLKRLFSPRPPR